MPANNRTATVLGWCLLVMPCAVLDSFAADASLPPAGAAVHELAGRSNLDARNWRLDPAVFTEITPFTAPDIAIALPIEQQEQEPGQVPVQASGKVPGQPAIAPSTPGASTKVEPLPEVEK